MRLCTTCNNTKPISEFPTREKGYKRSFCKSCLYQYQMRRWNRRKIEAVTYLGGQCLDCGFKGHPCSYDFHHRDPNEKEVIWTKLRLKAWTNITTELDKCDLLCSICHRKRHLNLDLWPAWDSNPEPAA